MKIISYNVNGIRAAVKKGFIDWLTEESPDIICLQEVHSWKIGPISKLLFSLNFLTNKLIKLLFLYKSKTALSALNNGYFFLAIN
jgi:aromatic ring-cleaving dioxygenase